MSINQDSNKINSTDHGGVGELVSYDEEGQIVDNSWFRKIFPVLACILIIIFSFGAGRLSVIENDRPGVSISYDPNFIQDASTVFGSTSPSLASPRESIPPLEKGRAVNTNTTNAASVVFASSQGKRYYYAGCKSTISEKNKVTFATAAMAESAGYTLAANCHK